MDKLKRADHSLWGRLGVLGGLYLVMLALNRWTPYLVDDYAYLFRWDNHEPLTGLGDLIPSMRAHAVTMNGRLLAHGLEQLFLLLPKTVFNLVNAGVLVYTLWAAEGFCLPEGKRSALLPLLLFAGLWVFLPVFGQVCLWQVGALNYLWALALSLAFLRPFVGAFRSPEAKTPLGRKLLFLPLAFLAGGYTEISSLIAILMAGALTILLCLRRGSLRCWLILPLLAAAAGYALLMRMPGEAANKAGSLELEKLLNRMVGVSRLYLEHFKVLTLAWGVLMTLALLAKVPAGRTGLSLIFFLGGAAAAYELIAASYIPERCLCTTALLLLIADGILLTELLPGGNRPGVLCAAAALGLVFAFSFTGGFLDVRDTRLQANLREQSILAQRRGGSSTVYVTRISPATPYSPAYGQMDLNTEDPDSWPNCYMARYYGVERVVWIPPEDFAASFMGGS